MAQERTKTSLSSLFGSASNEYTSAYREHYQPNLDLTRTHAATSAKTANVVLGHDLSDHQLASVAMSTYRPYLVQDSPQVPANPNNAGSNFALGFRSSEYTSTAKEEFGPKQAPPESHQAYLATLALNRMSNVQFGCEKLDNQTTHRTCFLPVSNTRQSVVSPVSSDNS